MKGYPLARLLAIRAWREDEAKREAEARREAVRQAEKVLGEKKQERADYASWRITEEQRLFELIRNRPVPMSEVDDFKQRVLDLRAREAELDEAVARAEKALVEAEEAREEAKARALRAARDKMKITEHGRLWGLAENQRLERLAEAELEEFPGRSQREAEGAEADMGDSL